MPLKARKRQNEKVNTNLEPMLNFNRTGTMFMKNHFETDDDVDKFVIAKDNSIKIIK
jgi:hypothetical protein